MRRMDEECSTRCSGEHQSPVKNSKTSALPISLSTSAAAERVAQEIFWMRLLQEMSTDVQRTNLSKGLNVCIKDIRYQLTKAA